MIDQRKYKIMLRTGDRSACYLVITYIDARCTEDLLHADFIELASDLPEMEIEHPHGESSAYHAELRKDLLRSRRAGRHVPSDLPGGEHLTRGGQEAVWVAHMLSEAFPEVDEVEDAMPVELVSAELARLLLESGVAERTGGEPVQ